MLSAYQTPSSNPLFVSKNKELSDLPQELRIIIIDRLDAKSKCRFAQCSFKCQNDVKMSRNWLKEIRFHAKRAKMTIEVAHDDQSRNSYRLIFEKESRSKYLKCLNNNGTILWEQKLDNSLELSHYATNTFKQMLQKYEKIEEVVLDGWNYGTLKNHFENLTNLKKLSVENCKNLYDIIVNFCKPLRSLNIDSISQSLQHFEQVYKVKDNLNLNKFTLDVCNLKRLNAKTVTMPIGNLSEGDIHLLVNDWQNGNWSIEEREFVFDLLDSNFDVSKFLELFDLPNEVKERGFFKVRHHLDARLKASLFFLDPTKIIFDVYA